jgi:hypothetical protein
MKRSLLALFATLCIATGVAQAQPAPMWWAPPVGVAWQWQLAGTFDTAIKVPVYDIDMFETPAATVAALHAAGRKAICYVDVGTWENFRPDKGKFPKSVLGKTNGWPGEKWLDIRKISILGPIMRARFSLCKAKGFDAVEPDNVDGYANPSGFPLTAAEQLTYNRYIANLAHGFGLGVALKNDTDQVVPLLKWFDFALVEQCFEFEECSAYSPFIVAGKAVFEVEYNLSTSKFCAKAQALHFSSMRKHLSLDAFREAC